MPLCYISSIRETPYGSESTKNFDAHDGIKETPKHSEIKKEKGIELIKVFVAFHYPPSC